MRHKTATQEMQNTEEMYLYRRNGVWQFRRRVPADLAGVIKPNHFHYSLGTKDKSEARLRLSAALAESEHIIRKERERLHNVPANVRLTWRKRRRIDAERAKRRRTRVFCQYNESEILNLVSRWFQKKARQTEDVYRDSFGMNNAEEREEIVKDLDEQWRYLNGELPPMDELVGFGEVRAILDEEDCALGADCLEDPLFRKFYGLVRQGLLGLNQMAISHVTFDVLDRYGGVVDQNADSKSEAAERHQIDRFAEDSTGFAMTSAWNFAVVAAS